MSAWVKWPTCIRGIEGVTCLAGVVNTSVSLQGALFAEIRNRIHQEKVWNAAGNWMVAIYCRGSLRRLISLRGWCGDSPNNPHFSQDWKCWRSLGTILISPWRILSGRTPAIRFSSTGSRCYNMCRPHGCWSCFVPQGTTWVVEPSAPRLFCEENATAMWLHSDFSVEDWWHRTDCEHTCRSCRVKDAQRHADSTDRVLIQLSRLSVNDHLCGECWSDRCCATPHRLPKEVLTLPERLWNSNTITERIFQCGKKIEFQKLIVRNFSSTLPDNGRSCGWERLLTQNLKEYSSSKRLKWCACAYHVSHWTRGRCTQTTPRACRTSRDTERAGRRLRTRRETTDSCLRFPKVDALAEEQPNTHPSSLPLTSPFRPDSLTSSWNLAVVDLDRGWPPLLGVADAARRRWSRDPVHASSSAAPRRRIPTSPLQFFCFWQPPISTRVCACSKEHVLVIVCSPWVKTALTARAHVQRWDETPVGSGYLASAVTTHLDTSYLQNFATSPLTLPPTSFPQLRPRNAWSMKENFQPLVTGIVVLPSWLPQHFDWYRRGQNLLFFSAARPHIQLIRFCLRSITSQVFCPRSLQAFGSPEQHQLTPLLWKFRVQLLSSHPRSHLPAHLVALLVCHFREPLEKFVRRPLAHHIRNSHSEYFHAPLASKSCHVQAVQHNLVVGFELSSLIIYFSSRASFSHLLYQWRWFFKIQFSLQTLPLGSGVLPFPNHVRRRLIRTIWAACSHSPFFWKHFFEFPLPREPASVWPYSFDNQSQQSGSISHFDSAVRWNCDTSFSGHALCSGICRCHLRLWPCPPRAPLALFVGGVKFCVVPSDRSFWRFAKWSAFYLSSTLHTCWCLIIVFVPTTFPTICLRSTFGFWYMQSRVNWWWAT